MVLDHVPFLKRLCNCTRISMHLCGLTYASVRIFPPLSGPRYDMLTYGFACNTEDITSEMRDWAEGTARRRIGTLSNHLTHLAEIHWLPFEPHQLPVDSLIAWL